MRGSRDHGAPPDTHTGQEDPRTIQDFGGSVRRTLGGDLAQIK